MFDSDHCVSRVVNIMLRQALLIVCALAGAYGFLGMGNRCVPVPSHLCAVAYDDDGCKLVTSGLEVGHSCWGKDVQVVGPCLLLVQKRHRAGLSESRLLFYWL